jgi:Na+/proline symporter
MDKTYLISQSTSLTLVIIISLVFTLLGLYHSQKFKGLNNYLTANRNVGLFSLTTSMVASALGAWILFGPASAATWGGVGAVIGLCTWNSFSNDILNLLGSKN